MLVPQQTKRREIRQWRVPADAFLLPVVVVRLVGPGPGLSFGVVAVVEAT